MVQLALPNWLHNRRVSTLLLLLEPMLIAYIASRKWSKTRDNTIVFHSSTTDSIVLPFQGIEIGEQDMAEATGLQRAWIITCSRCKKQKVLSVLQGNDFGRRDEIVNVARLSRWVEPLYAGIWLCPECVKIVVAEVERDMPMPMGDEDNA